MSLAEEVKKLSGQDVMLCFQCGECSSSCQMAGFKGFSPTKLIHALQLNREDLVGSYELCLHCFLCSVRCPQGISFPDVATSLSNISAGRGKVDRVERALLSELSSRGSVNSAYFALRSLGASMLISVLRLSGLRGLRMVSLLLRRAGVREDLLREVREIVGKV
ncbi:MAG: 4Fe-4S dicluster domain-containing protein [Candidatus Korarchaeum sp.]